METTDYLDAIGRDSGSLAAAGRAAIDNPVPSCPGWTVADLIGHVGQVHRLFAMVLDAGTEGRVRFSEVESSPGGPDAVSWLEQGTNELIGALEHTDPASGVRTWAGEHPAAWVFRRVAQETAMHRWDGENAAGDPLPIDAALAADGIDELFEVFVPRRGEGGLTGTGETIHLHATDREGEWLITLTPDGPTLSRGHAKGDVAARGTTSDLLLLLWNRRSPDDLEIFGDRTLLDRWQKEATI